ncbi:hypothetical protein GCM10018952_15950 [Streptosporangium vulgare]
MRLQATEMFAQGTSQAEVARLLRVSPMSASRWYRSRQAGGTAALASKGPAGWPCRLNEEQRERLEAELRAGPAAHGWCEDQRWTLARVAELIARLFHLRSSLRGVSLLLHRMGGSPRMSVHRAAERDEVAITWWRTERWQRIKRRRRLRAHGSASTTKPARSSRPPRARTWSRRGHPPVVTVSGKGSDRVSIAGLVCCKPHRRSRLIYRIRLHRGHKDERRSFAERDYADLLDAAHQQLGAPIVLVGDNVNTHISRAMQSYIAARDWLTVYRLPAYALELNPAEGIWANLRNGLGNLAVTGLDALNAIIKTRLKRMQYRPDLITGFFNETGLSFELA